MAVWSTQVANELISLSKKSPLTHMQIQRLIYISHGLCLKIWARPLSIDDPEARRFGPIYRLVWDSLRHTGVYPVAEKIPSKQILPYKGTKLGQWKEEEKDLVKRVYDACVSLASFQLATVTHNTDTPWDQIYSNGRGRNVDIPSSRIEDQFRKLLGDVTESDMPALVDILGENMTAKKISDAQNLVEKQKLAEIENIQSGRKLREKYATQILNFLYCYAGGVAFILILVGVPGINFVLPSAVLSILVGSTSVAAIGLVGFIARGLFRTPPLAR